MEKKVSVIIACYNEEKYLGNALDTLLRMDYPKQNLEIIIVDGGSTDSSLTIAKSYTEKFPVIKIFHNSKRISPVAFNTGIKESSAEFVMLMSAHSEYPDNYIKTLVDKIDELGADLIGGMAETKTMNVSLKTSSIVKVMTNKFGLGGAKVRTGVDKPQEADTVTGMFRKSIFEKSGLFNERLVRNQDMELSKRIISKGGKIFLIPDVKFTYFAREKFSSLWKNNFNNGYWVPKTVYITKNISSLCLRHFIPLAFVLSLIIPVIISIFWSPAIIATGLSLLAHFLFVLFISFRINDKSSRLDYLIKCFYTLHLSYGTGSLKGLIFFHDLFKKN